MIWGARPALLLAALVTVVGAFLGTVFGVAAAYFKGWVDSVVMFGVDVMLAFPALILLAAITGTLGNSLWILAMALIIVSIPAYTRIVRGAALAASSSRASLRPPDRWVRGRLRVVMREIVPNVLHAVDVLRLSRVLLS